LTSRGLKEADFAKIAEFLDRAVKIALDIQSKTGKKLQDFLAAIPHRTDILVRYHALFAKSQEVPYGFSQKREIPCLIFSFLLIELEGRSSVLRKKVPNARLYGQIDCFSQHDRCLSFKHFNRWW
jgi:hypothetical protein